MKVTNMPDMISLCSKGLVILGMVCTVGIMPARAAHRDSPPIEVSFDLPTVTQTPPEKPKPQQPQGILAFIQRLFTGGADSIVARTVGHAEGTRTINGGKTTAYWGHTDPGNQVWNLGSFSYQHCATCSPEEADVRQLRRLERQFHALWSQASMQNLTLSIAEALNGIDLANQAPLAALDQGGYVDRLQEAKVAGRSGDSAILWARTYSYINPKTQTWDAPGLGNNYKSIHRDQSRRAGAIEAVLDQFGDR
jgi:hypothetical protein